MSGDGTPPTFRPGDVAAMIATAFAKRAGGANPPRPQFCAGAYITHNHDGDALEKPMRVRCQDDVMPGYGLCASCSGRELEIVRALKAREKRMAQGEARTQSRRRSFDDR